MDDISLSLKFADIVNLAANAAAAAALGISPTLSKKGELKFLLILEKKKFLLFIFTDFLSSLLFY